MLARRTAPLARLQRLFTLDYFSRESQIGFAADTLEVIDQDRLAVGWRLGDTDIPRNDCLVHFAAHELAHVGDNLIGEIVARIVHGQHDAVDRQCRVERALDLFDRLQKLRQAFKREELALQRHQNGIGGRHRIDREQIERRRTIDQDVGEIVIARSAVECAQCIAKTKGAVALLADFQFETGKVECRGRDEELRHGSLQHGVAHRRRTGQHIVGRGPSRLAFDPEAGRGIALRVEVDNQNMLANGSECSAQIDGRRRLADPAFLVRNCQDPGPGVIGLYRLFTERNDLRIGGWIEVWLVGHAGASISSSCPARLFGDVWSFGRSPLAGPKAADDHDRTVGTGLTGYFCGFKSPIFSGIGQFGIYILPLGE